MAHGTHLSFPIFSFLLSCSAIEYSSLMMKCWYSSGGMIRDGTFNLSNNSFNSSDIDLFIDCLRIDQDFVVNMLLSLMYAPEVQNDNNETSRCINMVLFF